MGHQRLVDQLDAFEESACRPSIIPRPDHITEAVRLRKCLLDGEYDEVERSLLPLSTDVTPVGMHTFDYLVRSLGNWKGHRPEQLDLYVQEYSNTFIPYVIRGEYFTKWAWEARSGATIDHVTRPMYLEFRKRLVMARKDTVRSMELSSGNGARSVNPSAVATLLTIMQGEEVEKEDILEVFRSNPALLLDTWVRILVAVTEKWGGSHEQMFAIANEASATAPPRHPLHSLTVYAHAERSLYFHMDDDVGTTESRRAAALAYLARQDVVQDMLAAYARFTSGTEPAEGDPPADGAHAMFAYALYLIWKLPPSSGGGQPAHADAARFEMAKVTCTTDKLPSQLSYISAVETKRAMKRFCADLDFEWSGSRRVCSCITH
eukprot:TRINITY_DN886_c0_g2_i1.p1 TRINITY_DN886_c0_g2~~TRINITY_DN886_c0_g2_i1.p1  ORF type:complete len:377 (-),score=65.04 TRINITY_DN886_c0_g2_i1:100-1230(-)